MKANRTLHKAKTGGLTTNCKVIDVKDMIARLNREGHVDTRGNIINSRNLGFYSRATPIMDLDDCDLYPHESP